MVALLGCVVVIAMQQAANDGEIAARPRRTVVIITDDNLGRRIRGHPTTMMAG